MEQRVSRSLSKRLRPPDNIVVQACKGVYAQEIVSRHAVPSFVAALDSGLQIQLRAQRPSKRIAQLIDAVPAEVVVLGATAVERAGDIHRNRLGHGVRLVIGLDRLEPQFVYDLRTENRRLTQLRLPVAAGRIESALGQIESSRSLILRFVRDIRQIEVKRMVRSQPQLAAHAGG